MNIAKKRGQTSELKTLLGAFNSTQSAQVQPGEALQPLPIACLQPCRYQPRRRMDAAKLAELADSIRAQGIIQPIVARPSGDGQFEIVAGERRWRAAQHAGLSSVPVVVRELDDRTVVAMALIENIQREDLNPLEEATALQRLITDFSLTHAQAAQAVGRSRAAVSNLLRLIDLPAGVRELLENRRLEMGHARALLTLAPELATQLAQDAADEGWSVREVEHRAKQFAKSKLLSAPKVPPSAKSATVDIVSLENELSRSLGARVAIKQHRSGKGALVIHYTDLDTLGEVLEKLRPPQPPQTQDR